MYLKSCGDGFVLIFAPVNTPLEGVVGVNVSNPRITTWAAAAVGSTIMIVRRSTIFQPLLSLVNPFISLYITFFVSAFHYNVYNIQMLTNNNIIHLTVR